MRTISYNIAPEHDGQTVEHYLKRVHGYSTRILKTVKHHERGLLLNGTHTRTVDRIAAGDLLTINLEEEDPQAYIQYDFDVQILYHDTDVIVFNKPPGMPTHPAKHHQQFTLANVFAHVMAGEGKACTFRSLNRLDKDTSGAVVVAKNTYAATRLDRQVDKVYRALCCGVVRHSAGMIDAPIGRIDDEHINRIVTENGQFARTEFKVEAWGERYTLLRFKLHTGRTHQIRVHMSWIGHPVAGDDLYGTDRSIIARQALHCAQVSFPHPLTGEQITVDAPLLEDMQAAIALAELEQQL